MHNLQLNRFFILFMFEFVISNSLENKCVQLILYLFINAFCIFELSTVRDEWTIYLFTFAQFIFATYNNVTPRVHRFIFYIFIMRTFEVFALASFLPLAQSSILPTTWKLNVNIMFGKKKIIDKRRSLTYLWAAATPFEYIFYIKGYRG